jgi:hypothetical protein
VLRRRGVELDRAEEGGKTEKKGRRRAEDEGEDEDENEEDRNRKTTEERSESLNLRRGNLSDRTKEESV